MIPADAMRAELAQKLADAINPPRTYEAWDYKTKEFYTHTDRSGPHDSPYIVFQAEDGYNSTRSATYLELITAALPIFEAALRDQAIATVEAVPGFGQGQRTVRRAAVLAALHATFNPVSPQPKENS